MLQDVSEVGNVEFSSSSSKVRQEMVDVFCISRTGNSERIGRIVVIFFPVPLNKFSVSIFNRSQDPFHYFVLNI
jgi:hypothetical protein